MLYAAERNERMCLKKYSIFELDFMLCDRVAPVPPVLIGKPEHGNRPDNQNCEDEKSQKPAVKSISTQNRVINGRDTKVEKVTDGVRNSPQPDCTWRNYRNTDTVCHYNNNLI